MLILYLMLQVDYLAFPADSRMLEEDIQGADRLEANADNDGWLFLS